ncbi:MAG: hypothetical protein AAGJ70_07970 [Pseudomonadota bacterium]
MLSAVWIAAEQNATTVREAERYRVASLCERALLDISKSYLSLSRLWVEIGRKERNLASDENVREIVLQHKANYTTFYSYAHLMPQEGRKAALSIADAIRKATSYALNTSPLVEVEVTGFYQLEKLRRFCRDIVALHATK